MITPSGDAHDDQEYQHQDIAVCEANQQAGKSYAAYADEDHGAGPNPVSHESRRQLGNPVGETEGSAYQSRLRIAQPELLFNKRHHRRW